MNRIKGRKPQELSWVRTLESRPGRRRPRFGKGDGVSNEEVLKSMTHLFSLLTDLGGYDENDLKEIRQIFLSTLSEIEVLRIKTCEANGSMEEFLDVLLNYIEQQRKM